MRQVKFIKGFIEKGCYTPLLEERVNNFLEELDKNNNTVIDIRYTCESSDISLNCGTAMVIYEKIK